MKHAMKCLYESESVSGSGGSRRINRALERKRGEGRANKDHQADQRTFQPFFLPISRGGIFCRCRMSQVFWNLCGERST
uniref:Uncharacterized protein n=1 Tax=Picea sitchensis TaxID=3332 RepID=A9NSP3_PICSI|nr:unknown [Picea sitchensis]